MIEPRNRLDPRVKIAWRLQYSAVLAPVVAACGVLAFLGPGVGIPAWIATGVAAVAFTLGVTFVWAWPEISYRRWRWEVAQEEVRLREGIVIVSHTVIPMVRIQHVDTSQGPIMRAVGLSDVHISTAAGKHTIPALSDADAAALRDRIATLARVTDDGGL